MPLVIANTAILVASFGTVVFSSMRSDILGTIEGVGISALILIAITLIAQLTVIAVLERRSGRAERAELLRVVREVLGP